MSEILIVGIKGRMGQELQSVINDNGELSFTDKLTANTKLIIDFSTPDGFNENLKLAEENKIPFLSGTTALSDKDFENLKKASKSIPVLWSANMSLGVAVMTEMLKNFKAVSNFNFEIEETHHVHKKDNPSGTAIHLQKSLEASIEKNIPTPVGLRQGEVFGDHKVVATSAEEVITVEHKALSRRVFASGAVKAGVWLLNQPVGHYDLSDVLKL